MDILGTTINQTKKDNYIFLAKKPGKEYSIYGYDSQKQKFLVAKDLTSQKDLQRQAGLLQLGLKDEFLQLSYFE